MLKSYCNYIDEVLMTIALIENYYLWKINFAEFDKKKNDDNRQICFKVSQYESLTEGNTECCAKPQTNLESDYHYRTRATAMWKRKLFLSGIEEFIILFKVFRNFLILPPYLYQKYHQHVSSTTILYIKFHKYIVRMKYSQLLAKNVHVLWIASRHNRRKRVRTIEMISGSNVDKFESANDQINSIRVPATPSPPLTKRFNQSSLQPISIQTVQCTAQSTTSIDHRLLTSSRLFSIVLVVLLSMMPFITCNTHHGYSTNIIKTKYGPLRGIILRTNPPVEAFLGVPYATPPIGSLRYVGRLNFYSIHFLVYLLRI